MSTDRGAKQWWKFEDFNFQQCMIAPYVEFKSHEALEENASWTPTILDSPLSSAGAAVSNFIVKMSAQAIPSGSDANSKPRILMLSLDHQPFFDDMYSRLIDAMAARATLSRVTKPSPALTFLSTSTPHAIFITDPGLLNASNSAVLARVVSYVRNGGTAVIAGHFSSFVRPHEMAAWFRSHWGVQWEAGDYQRTTVHLNSSARSVLPRHGLPLEYSLKAVFLKNVASDAAWYLPSDSSRTESLVFMPTSVDRGQTPVAMASIGEGWLGYVGDVNTEMGSDVVVLAMLGL